MDCSFCGRKVMRRFALCPRCRAEVMSVAPDDARYQWFVRAVSRSLRDAFPECVLVEKKVQ